MVPLPLLFLGHGFCSVALTLLNKSIAVAFTHAWSVIAIQNLSTLFFVPLLHVLGIHHLQPLRKDLWLAVIGNSALLVLVLWSSIKTMQFVSVPLYVVIRNTIPFQTMLLERLCLGRQVGAFQVLALAVTFSGTLLYKMGEFEGDIRGIYAAFLNTALVAVLSVYERALTVRVKKQLVPMNINFYKVLVSMPLLMALQVFQEGGLTKGLELLSPEQHFTAGILAVSALLGFAVGTLVTNIVSQVSGTTVATANIFYKFVTTIVSRFTHPSDVAMQGWIGYALCTIGFCMYTFGPKPSEPRKTE